MAVLAAIDAGTCHADPNVITVSQDGTGDFLTIQQAIDGAPENAVIRIGAGTWKESVRIDKPITLDGADWRKTRVVGGHEMEASQEVVEALENILRELDSEKTRNEVLAAFHRVYGTSPSLTVHDVEGVVVRNITVLLPSSVRRGSFRDQPAIAIQDADAKIESCAVLASPGQGLGISGKSHVTVRDCLVANAWGQGIRVAIDSSGSVEILNCDLRNCVYSGISISQGCENVLVRGCRIHGTGWHGVRYDSSSPCIEQNLIYDTAVSGIYASGQTSAVVRNNLFYLSGISCWFQNADTIERNTFVGDRHSDSSGGLTVGVSVLGTSTPKIRRNIFVQCENAVCLGDIGSDSPFAKSTGKVKLTENVFWDNERSLAQSVKSENGSIELQEGQLPEGNLREEPQFVDAENKDYSIQPDFPLRSKGIGADEFPAFASPWPVQPEESRAIEAVEERKSQTARQRRPRGSR